MSEQLESQAKPQLLPASRVMIFVPVDGVDVSTKPIPLTVYCNPRASRYFKIWFYDNADSSEVGTAITPDPVNGVFGPADIVFTSPHPMTGKTYKVVVKSYNNSLRMDEHFDDSHTIIFKYIGVFEA